MSVSKPADRTAVQKAIEAYVALLRTRPVATKAVTSACIAGLGNIISQLVTRKGQSIDWKAVAAYAGTGLCFTGPIIHYFYIWLDKAVPKHKEYARLKRIILDRFIFAPPFLFIYFFILAKLEGQSSGDAMKKIGEIFWPTLKMNWKMWTPLQFININYVPQQYRVLFASVVSLVWTVYVAVNRS